MKKILLLTTLLLLKLTYGQEQIENFSILGKKYRYEYDDINQKLKIIRTQPDDNYIVNQSKINSDSFSSFFNYIKTYFEDQEYNFLKGKFKFKELDHNGANVLSIITALNAIVVDGNDPLDDGIITVEGLPKNLQKFEISKIQNKGQPDKYELKNKELYKGSIALSDKSKTTVKNEIKKQLNTNIKVIITKLKDDFETYLTEFDKFYKNNIQKAQGYSFLTTQEFKITSSSNKSYNILFMDKGKTFSLKLCEVLDDNSCSNPGLFNYTISAKEFENNFYKNYENENFDKTNINDVVIDNLLKIVRKEKEQIEVEKDKEEITKSFNSLVEALDNEKVDYSGKISVNEEFYLYNDVWEEDEKNSCRRLWYTLFTKKECCKRKIKTRKKVKTGQIFLVDTVNISFYNDRINELTVVGKIKNNPSKQILLQNDEYSLTLDDFKEKTQTDAYNNKSGIKGYYYYSDILDFLPLYNGSDFHTNVKNGSISVTPEKVVKVEEKSFLDYFTGVIFADPLGFNPKNENNLSFAEGSFRIPLNRRHTKRRTLIDHISISGMVNLVGNTEEASLKIDLEGLRENEPKEFKSDNFDLLKFSNSNFNVKLSAYTYEIKKWKSFLHLRYGLELLRTRFDYNTIQSDTTIINDITTISEKVISENSFQIYSIGQHADALLEIRPPSQHFGADLSLGLNWFGETGGGNVDFKSFNNTPNLKFMTTLYVNPSKQNNNGFFVRLGANYNLGKYELFPRILFGYATNLTTFINKSKR